MGRILLKKTLLCSTAFNASLPPTRPLRFLSYRLFGDKKPKPIQMISGERRCIIKYGTISSTLVVGGTPGPSRHKITRQLLFPTSACGSPWHHLSHPFLVFLLFPPLLWLATADSTFHFHSRVTSGISRL